MSVTKYTTPAELRRGATFADDFESNALVEKNGGTLGSAVTLINNGITVDAANEGVYYRYNTQHTDLTIIIDVEDITFSSGAYQIFVTERDTPGIQFEFGISDDASTTAKKLYFYGTGFQRSSTAFSSNAKQIGFTLSGTTGKFFVDGQQLGTSVTSSVGVLQNKLSIGTAFNGSSTPAMATIKRVFISKEALSDQEILDYHNGATYNPRPDIVMDGTYANYKPGTVSKHLDSSGNGNDFYVGIDGTVGTGGQPIKAEKIGYTPDGAADVLAAVSLETGKYTSNFSCLMLVDLTALPVPSAAWQGLVGRHDETDAEGWLFAIGTYNPIRYVFKNDNTKLNSFTGITPETGIHTVGFCIPSSGEEIIFYYDEVAYPTGVNFDGSITDGGEVMTLLKGIDNGESMNGTMKIFKSWDQCLTPIQMFDEGIRMKAKFNDI